MEGSALVAERYEGQLQRRDALNSPISTRRDPLLYIILVEGYAVFRHILPNALRWLYRTRITQQVTCTKIESTDEKIKKTANLFLHTKIKEKQENASAVLLLHGDGGAHPYSLLHLADIAASEGKTVFSVHLPYDDKNHEVHRSLLRGTIDKIQSLIEAKGSTLTEFIAAGHSRGAIEAAYAAFVEEDHRITKVISLASRLRVIDPSFKPCKPSLKSTVNAVYDKAMQKDTPMLCQISAGNDWNADLEASRIKKDNHLLVNNAMHTNVLFYPETLNQFRLWVRA